jgi:hypothetical protein
MIQDIELRSIELDFAHWFANIINDFHTYII